MSQGRQDKGLGVSVSLPGLLALMGGLLLLYCYWRLHWSIRLESGFLRLVVLGGGTLAAVWGINEIVVSVLSSTRGRRVLRARVGADRSQKAHGSQPVGLRRLLSLFGLLLIAGGATLSFLIAVRAESGPTVAVGFTGGVLLIVWGVHNVAEAFRPRTGPRHTRHRQTLAIPGVAFLAMMVLFLFASLIGRSNMLMLVFALMAGPFVLNGWITFRMLKKTGVSRRAPRRAMVGEPVDVELTLSNDKELMSSWLIDVTDRIRGQGEDLQTGVLFTRVAPRNRQTGTYRVQFARRGRYTFGPLAVTSRFPLGFVERGMEFDLAEETIVYPRLGRLTPAWKRETMTATELVERDDPRTGLYDDEFHRLREHRWGDNPRAIHWRTSARRNELMVREYHQTREWDLVVLLDLWTPKKPAEADRERVERAVSFAATVCIDHMRTSRESVVTLSAGGKKMVRWQGQAGPAAFDSLLETLALLEAGRSADPETLLAGAPLLRTASRRLILITTRTGVRLGRDAQAHGLRPAGFDPGAAPRIETYPTDGPTLARFIEFSS